MSSLCNHDKHESFPIVGLKNQLRKNNFLHCLQESKTKFYSRPCIVWLRRGSKVWTVYISLIISLKPLGFSILINMRSTYNSIIPVCTIFFRGSPIFVGLRCMNNASGYFGSPIPKKKVENIQTIFKTNNYIKNTLLIFTYYIDSHDLPIDVIKGHCVSTTWSPLVRASISNVTPMNIDSLTHCV